MATGDQADLLSRLRAVIPASWFPDTQSGQPTNTPVLDGILSGVAWVWAQTYALLAWVKAQTRILTASGVWLDVIALDFFGSFLARRGGELDAALKLRIILELFRPKGTRYAMRKALTDLTGSAPAIFEPTNTGDTGGYTQGGVGYGAGGGYGTMTLPFQCFVTAVRPNGGGIASVAGYGNIAAGVTTMPGGYYNPTAGVTAGAIEYGGQAMIAVSVPDSAILAEINDVRPAATTVWTDIVGALTPPAPPGAITGLTAG